MIRQAMIATTIKGLRMIRTPPPLGPHRQTCHYHPPTMSITSSAASAFPAACCARQQRHGVTIMKRYLIERDIPGVGKLNGEELKGAAAKSNEALAKLAGKAQWLESFVVDDK